MIKLEYLRSLNFAALSGLVKDEDRFFAVSDDQLSLEIFQTSQDAPSQFLRLFPGALPEEPKARKAAKPDLEILMLLETSASQSQKILLAMPSGSTDRRQTGALVFLPHNRNEPRTSSPVDVSPLYDVLRTHDAELNLEGGIMRGDALLLFQRGNGAANQNAVIELDSKVFLKQLFENQIVGKESFRRWVERPLRKIHDTKLGFTDAAVTFRNGQAEVWYLAVAEDTISTYEDGAFSAAVLGRLDGNFEVIEQHQLEIQEKPEGLCFDNKDPDVFYLVTDADNPQKTSQLFKGRLPTVTNTKS